MSSERKYCSRCGRYLLLHNFDKRAASVDGLRQVCRRCRSLEYLRKKSGLGNDKKEIKREAESEIKGESESREAKNREAKAS